MKNTVLIRQEKDQQQKMEAYYRFQSKFYDSTRWSFLFGRKQLIRHLPSLDVDATILEVGCGTGYNLPKIAQRYPTATIYGLDTSATMIERSGQKIAPYSNVYLLNEAYGLPSDQRPENIDMVVFSYALSMINPQWKDLLDYAQTHLKSGGYIAVVDFEYSRFKWFRQHMANNHVRMENHLVPYLQKRFETVSYISNTAYGGWWKYFEFIGKV